VGRVRNLRECGDDVPLVMRSGQFVGIAGDIA